jgi:diguanylate cyclase (GGDEF)-like protein/PAS domain S-box-containing protein
MLDNTPETIAAEQTRLLYTNSLMPIVVSVLASTLLAASLWTVISQKILVSWLSIFIIVSLLRVRLLFLYRNRQPGSADQQNWHLRFLIGTYIIATLWGAASFLLLPEQSLAHQIVFFMIMVGMAAGGVSSLCPSITVLIGFLSLILLPLILKLVLTGSGEAALKALLVFLFWGVIVVGGKKINRNIRENIELRLQSIKREQILKISEERYRHIFSNAPLGIIQYDAQGIIMDCNEEIVRILGSTKEKLVGFDMLTKLRNEDMYKAIKNSITTGEGYYEGDYTSVTGSRTTPIRAFFKTIHYLDRGVSGGIGIVEDFTDKRESEELIQYHASYDSLTGLPNRRLFLDHLAGEISRAQRHGYYGALLYLDLDNFKTINDSLGHSVGDEYLKMVSKRLIDFTRKEDVASRMGGDEFTLVITELDQDPESAAGKVRGIAEELSLCLSSPCRISGVDLQSTVSIGISMFPLLDKDVNDILKQADTAMYRAKAAGRNEISFFLPSMQEAADEKLRLSNQLRQALKQQELLLYFQPQVDFSGTLLGAEALLRWQHPVRGRVSPAVFLSVAEETGLMQDIGQWVLRQTCTHIKQWQDAGYLRKAQIISLNISGKEIASPDFVSTIRKALEETGADPNHLGIELTEGSLISTGSDIVDKITQVRKFGVKFSVDDFGTGYSSLSYLKSLPLHTLKIDRTFVKDIKDASQNVVLVDTIIMMASNLGLEVIAEGVETEQELHYLRSKGCEVYQGFYFCKPLKPAPFLEILKAGRLETGGARS